MRLSGQEELLIESLVGKDTRLPLVCWLGTCCSLEQDPGLLCEPVKSISYIFQGCRGGGGSVHLKEGTAEETEPEPTVPRLCGRRPHAPQDRHKTGLEGPTGENRGMDGAPAGGPTEV